jgi:hypothetical protein
VTVMSPTSQTSCYMGRRIAQGDSRPADILQRGLSAPTQPDDSFIKPGRTVTALAPDSPRHRLEGPISPGCCLRGRDPRRVGPPNGGTILTMRP